jgi:hypothetical protein
MPAFRNLKPKVLLLISFVQFELLMASVHGQSAPDFTQAQAVLDLLGSCRAGTASTVAMEKVVSLPGTGLAIAKLS